MISHRRQPKITCALREFLGPLKLSNQQLCKIMSLFEDALNKGLGADTHDTASVKCYQTYIQDLPSGKETGRFIVLELAGLNFRVMLITLEQDFHHEKDMRSYSIPNEKTNATASEFFDFIVECIDLFMEENKLKTAGLGLGFCFGFPVRPDSLTKGTLTEWSKKFNVSGVIGQDVVALLRQALAKRNINVHPVIMINDTIGCMLSCAWGDQKCRMGVIIGTGTNACYLEKIENIGKFDGDPKKPHMIINTEWSNFGSDGVLDDIKTPYDEEIDSTSISPGIQIFEKMTSSLYISEIVRLVIVKCAQEKHLFEGELSELLQRTMTFLPEFIFEIEGDSTHELSRTFSILEVMKLKNVTIQDCVNVKYICKVICRRSAHLIAAAISTIVNRMAVSPVTIAFDGSFYRKHPKYKEILREKIKGMINPNIQFGNVEEKPVVTCMLYGTDYWYYTPFIERTPNPKINLEVSEEGNMIFHYSELSFGIFHEITQKNNLSSSRFLQIM